MVGTAGGGESVGAARSKEEVGMMALHEALRNVCLNSDWTYSVFWTIRPRPRCRGGNGCKVGDDNGSLMLMWEDGYCRARTGKYVEEIDGEDPVRKAFSKMSIQLYNYGEGLMGKVASDKCHKWVFKEPSDCEPNISNYWQSSFDALPPEWTDQFASGIQTIAVIQAGHGLLQLGSCKIIPEDLHFVLRMRHMFESLGYQSGFFLSQLFSSNRSCSPAPSAGIPLKQPPVARPPPPQPQPQPLFDQWSNQHPLAMPTMPPMPLHHMNEMIAEHEPADLKWPNGLSIFSALTGRPDDAKLLLGSGEHAHGGAAGTGGSGGSNPEEYLSLDSDSSKMRKVEGGNGNGKFKRSFTLPARMSMSNSSASSPGMMEYRGGEGGVYSDLMDNYLE
ncbi:Serine/threonine-protein kinase WNK (With No Lysine)-like protein [Rhynchospora pubera]|uniref:Serine/threonine-protein kinase WNK (With No Lysine)-like protein n=1 Tax=Rhynchospora pubera TaxID=906938 RepID=A0AAV8G3Z8_9POAL|nr:Serine/threonine-protein kinase WNK (With No Lysine)-like protein [Rhynchospora pubera]